MKKTLFLFVALIFATTFINAQGFEVVENTPPMNVSRHGHAAVSLPNGKVLVVGGHTQGFLLTSTAEIYNPLTNSWTLYTIDNPHDGASIVKLSNGKFMFFGGYSSGYGVGQSTVTTIFDPATNAFSTGPQMNVARGNSTAVLLKDNRVMIVGNWYNTGNAEIFDPSTNIFTSIGIPVNQRSNPLVFPTNDGGAVIIGGSGNYGTPNFTDIVYYNPVSMDFTTLSTEIIEGESGWITSWSSTSGDPSEMKLSDGSFIFMVYRNLSIGNYEYKLVKFDPETKKVTKINSTPELPTYTGTSPNNWGFTLSMIKNPLNGLIYILGLKFVAAPYPHRIYTYNSVTGVLNIPEGELNFDYYLYTSAKAWSNNQIMCTGGTIDGSNFEISNAAKLLKPQLFLGTTEIEKNSTDVQVYPNPVSSNSFQIKVFKGALHLLEIIDMNGNLVKSLPLNPNSKIHKIERGNISSGLYILKMSGEQSSIIKKIIFK